MMLLQGLLIIVHAMRLLQTSIAFLGVFLLPLFFEAYTDTSSMDDYCYFSVYTSQSAKFKVKYKSMHSTGISAKEGANQGLIKAVNRFVCQCTFIPQSIITIAHTLSKTAPTV